MRRQKRRNNATDGAISSQQFERELDVFYRQVAEPAQFLFTERGIDRVALANKRTLRALNATPMFWNTVVSALQYAAIVAVGRAFDHDTPYNAARIVRIAQQNPQLFTKDALAARKRKENANADEWLPSYLRQVHVPSASEFRRLRKLVYKYQASYDNRLRPIRRQHYAHTDVTDDTELSAIFAMAQFTEIEKMVVFLLQLHEALRDLFRHGRRVRLQRMPRSSRQLVRRPFHDPRNMTVQEKTIIEVRRFLHLLTKGYQSTNTVKGK
jgi:hypothetical protein